MLDLVCRPIALWPAELRRSRESSPFSAAWTSTRMLLERELEMLRAKRAVLELDLAEGQIRRDGWPMANARQPGHPGVILSFDSKHGPLRYWTDRFGGGIRQYGHGSPPPLPGWQCNVRAIALGLEALRKVDRYGIGDSGEQYRGWNALGAGTPMPAAGPMTVEQAAAFLVEHGEWGGEQADPADLIDDVEVSRLYYREAAKRLHPDAGGDTADFQRLTEAKRILDAHHATRWLTA